MDNLLWKQIHRHGAKTNSIPYPHRYRMIAPKIRMILLIKAAKLY
jgi:hypothetical protein